jgi:hypothetical protein
LFNSETRFKIQETVEYPLNPWRLLRHLSGATLRAYQFIEFTFKKIKVYSEPSGQKLEMQHFQKKFSHKVNYSEATLQLLVFNLQVFLKISRRLQGLKRAKVDQ